MSVVVVGIPDARLTEMLVACIRVKNNWHWLNRNFVQSNRKDLQLSSEILRIYCKEKNLAGYGFTSTSTKPQNSNVSREKVAMLNDYVRRVADTTHLHEHEHNYDTAKTILDYNLSVVL